MPPQRPRGEAGPGERAPGSPKVAAPRPFTRGAAHTGVASLEHVPPSGRNAAVVSLCRWPALREQPVTAPDSGREPGTPVPPSTASACGPAAQRGCSIRQQFAGHPHASPPAPSRPGPGSAGVMPRNAGRGHVPSDGVPQWDAGAPCGGACSACLLCDCSLEFPEAKPEAVVRAGRAVPGGTAARDAAVAKHSDDDGVARLPARCGERCRSPAGKAALFPRGATNGDPWVRHGTLGVVPLSRALQAEAWVMFDAWDSVSVVGTSLFLAQAITALSRAAGSTTPRALWSFLGSASTWASLAAFLALGPIGETQSPRGRPANARRRL